MGLFIDFVWRREIPVFDIFSQGAKSKMNLVTSQFLKDLYFKQAKKKQKNLPFLMSQKDLF